MQSERVSNTFKKVIKVSVIIAILVGLILFEKLQRAMFRTASIDAIINIQANDSKSTIGFFKFIYYLGDTRCYIVLLLILFNLMSRQNNFYFTLVISQGIFLEAFLKMAFKDGRPYMYNQKIFPYICELSFGNPSGEAINCISFMSALALYVYNKLKDQEEEITDKQKIGCALGLLFSLFFIILFCLQGIYNGNCTIDEVLFGVELGLFIGILSHFQIKPALDKHITNLLEGMYVYRYRFLTTAFSIMILVLFLTITIEYLVVLSVFKAPQTWMYMISVKCPVSSQLTELVFQDAVFVEFGLMFYIFGCYVGLMVDAKNYKGSYHFINDTPLKKTLARIVISAFVIIPIYVCPVYFIKSTKYPLIILMVKYGLPSFIIGLLFYGYSKIIYRRFNLIKEDEEDLDSSMSLSQIEEQEEETRAKTGKSMIFDDRDKVKSTF